MQGFVSGFLQVSYMFDSDIFYIYKKCDMESNEGQALELEITFYYLIRKF